MKIVRIFAEGIFSITLPEFEKEEENEFHRTLELWRDIEYLKSFFDENQLLIVNNHFIGEIKSVHDFIDRIYDEVEELEMAIEESAEDGTLDELFEYLHHINSAIRGEGSFKKLKIDLLRLYSIRIENEYLITGGAIKITRSMQEHRDTHIQLKRLREVNEFLKEEQIWDGDSLLDFMDTQN